MLVFGYVQCDRWVLCTDSTLNCRTHDGLGSVDFEAWPTVSASKELCSLPSGNVSMHKWLEMAGVLD